MKVKSYVVAQHFVQARCSSPVGKLTHFAESSEDDLTY